MALYDEVYGLKYKSAEEQIKLLLALRPILMIGRFRLKASNQNG